jgi:hypothetical protein
MTLNALRGKRHQHSILGQAHHILISDVRSIPSTTRCKHFASSLPFDILLLISVVLLHLLIQAAPGLSLSSLPSLLWKTRYLISEISRYIHTRPVSGLLFSTTLAAPPVTGLTGITEEHELFFTKFFRHYRGATIFWIIAERLRVSHVPRRCEFRLRVGCSPALLFWTSTEAFT